MERARDKSRLCRGDARNRADDKYPFVLFRKFLALPMYSTSPFTSSQRYTPVFAGKSFTFNRRESTCSLSSPKLDSTASAREGSFLSKVSLVSSSSTVTPTGSENSASVNSCSENSFASAFHTGPTSDLMDSSLSRAISVCNAYATWSASAPARFKRHANIAASTSS